MAELSYEADGSDLFGYGYTVDARGNITRITDSLTGDDIVTYSYDGQSRLLNESYAEAARSYSYTYDKAGNLLTATNGQETIAYTYGDED